MIVPAGMEGLADFSFCKNIFQAGGETLSGPGNSDCEQVSPVVLGCEQTGQYCFSENCLISQQECKCAISDRSYLVYTCVQTGTENPI